MGGCYGACASLILTTGISGIETWRDALEFIQLGCCNVQVCTSVIQFGYRIIDDMISGLQIYMASRGISQLSDLVGEKIKDFSLSLEDDRVHFYRTSARGTPYFEGTASTFAMFLHAVP